MKPGDEIQCPHCGKNAFILKIAEMEAWTKVGDILACSLCNAKIADLNKDETSSKNKEQQASKALSNFLGIEKEKLKPLEVTEEETHFCKNCAHLIPHPFLIKCHLHQKDVHPMDDCPDFTKVKKNDTKI